MWAFGENSPEADADDSDWFTRARLDEIAGANLYSYVANDPLGFVDEEGLERRPGGSKGERGRTAKPEGTKNPDKKFRKDPVTGRYKFRGPDGKWRVKPPGWVPLPRIPQALLPFPTNVLFDLCRKHLLPASMCEPDPNSCPST
jgi:hypothetical protein